MTDAELARFLCIDNDDRWPRAIANLKPETRAVFERMAEVEMELKLWEAGFGPKPTGVIICHEHKRGRR